MALAIAAFALFSPILALPFMGDDFNVLYWAAASRVDPQLLLQPWYGGFLGRLVPKLLLLLGTSVAGPRHEVFQLVNLLLHVANVLLIERVARVWTGSRRVAFTAAALFAVGFGFYGWAVMKVSNISMSLALALTLWAFIEWQDGRRGRALALWLVALATHETILLAPLLLPLVPDSRREAAETRDVWPTRLLLAGLAVAALALLLPDRAGKFAARLLELPGFTLLPVKPGPTSDVSLFGLSMPRAISEYVSSHLLAVGLVAMLPLAWAATRGAASRFAVAWMYLTWLPAAALMSGWTTPGLQARYLEVPAVGTCLLVALWLDRIPSRRTRRLSILGLTVWSLIVLGCVWLAAWNVVIASPRWQEQNREFWQELEELDRTRRPLPYSLDVRGAARPSAPGLPAPHASA